MSPAPPAILLAIFLATSSAGLASEPSAIGQLAARNLDTHCPLQPPATLEQWERRAADLRLQVKVSVGLLPYPTLDPVAPKIYDKKAMDGYTVEKCIFESLPGLWVTGTLYRPLSDASQENSGDQSLAQKRPGILCPHGHWNNGRFYEAPDVPRQLATGAERFECAAINPMQARCVQLARMGCVVYQYDMLGYADSQQIPSSRAHGFSQQQSQEVTEEGWLLYSPLAEMHTQSVMGLQTLATIRAADMLLTLPEVDPNRIAITGASGGGTQSFIAAAIDPRIAVSFPAVMVSTGMQGGCTCENCSMLRTGTGNVEMAALFAPKPMGLTAADDWTRTMPTDGFPQLKQIYQLYDQPDKVALFPGLHFGHNYNHVSRVAMYGWMNDHFGLGFTKPILETDFTRLSADELTVWDAENHPMPEGGEQFERRLMKLWADIVDVQLTGLKEGDRIQRDQHQEILRDGWRVVLGLTTAAAVETQPAELNELNEPSSDEEPAASDGEVIRISVGDTKGWFFKPVTQSQPLVDNGRLAAGYTYGYNHCQFVQQAQRLARALLQLAAETEAPALRIQASGAGAALAAAAVFCAREFAAQQENESPNWELALDANSFRFSEVQSIQDPNFVPGSTRFGDLNGLLSCLE
jgi:dienelactone hydrolase